MEYAISVLLSGISVGGQYALIAIGYTMVYGILRLINFAHGDVFMVSGLIAIYLTTMGLPLPVTLALAVLITVLLGFLIERVAYKPLRSAPRMSVMISAIGVKLSPAKHRHLRHRRPAHELPHHPRPVQNGHHRRGLHHAGDRRHPVLVIALVFGLVQLINHTKIGMAMRAVAKDFETSQLMGIKINRVISTTFIIGSALAALGSILYFTNYPTSPHRRRHARSEGLCGGGVRRDRLHPRAVIGAFLIGICENIIKALPFEGATTFVDAFTFALLIIVLVFKPTGLFGEKATEKCKGAGIC